MIVKLQGGLGNQMFQYAYGATEAAKRKEELLFDTSLLESGNPPRTLELSDFLTVNVENSTDALQGYWQGEKYFDTHKIRKLFSYALNIYGTRTEECFIGVRRSDYLWPERIGFHGVLPLEYYQEAMSLFPKETKFVCFSDDREWVRNHLKIDSFQTRPSRDMRGMARFRNAIIANSSFHWWGAWLGPDRRGKVIAPKKWFATEVPGSGDIVPERWITI